MVWRHLLLSGLMKSLHSCFCWEGNNYNLVFINIYCLGQIELILCIALLEKNHNAQSGFSILFRYSQPNARCRNFIFFCHDTDIGKHKENKYIEYTTSIYNREHKKTRQTLPCNNKNNRLKKFLCSQCFCWSHLIINHLF